MAETSGEVSGQAGGDGRLASESVPDLVASSGVNASKGWVLIVDVVQSVGLLHLVVAVANPG